MHQNLETLSGRILMNMSIATLQIDRNGLIVYSNKAWQQSFPDILSQNQNLLDPIWDFIDLQCKKVDLKDLPWTQSLKQRKPIHNNKYGFRHKGSLKWYMINSTPLEEDEQIVGAIVNFWDITANQTNYDCNQRNHACLPKVNFSTFFLEGVDLKNLEPPVHIEERRYQSFLENAPFSIEIYNEQGFLIDANRKWEKLWGFNKNQSIDKLEVFKSPHIRTLNIRTQIAEAYAGKKGMIARQEFSKLNDSGVSNVARCIYYPVKDDNHEVLNVVLFTEDITKPIQTKEVLLENQPSNKSLLNSLPDAVALIDEKGKIEKTNHLWTLLNASKALFSSLCVGNNFLKEFVKHRNDQKLQQIHKNTHEVLSGRLAKYETELNYPESGQSWYMLRVNPINYPLKGAVVSFLDISHKKKVERALEHSVIKYRNIYNRTPIMLHSLNQFGMLISVSDFWLEKMGYDRYEVIGKPFSELIHPDCRETALGIMKTSLGNDVVKDQQLQLITKSGGKMDVLHSCINESTQNGHCIRSLNVLVDVSKLKSIEMQLHRSKEYVVEAQKIAGVGSFELNLTTKAFEASHLLKELCEFDSDQEMNFDMLMEMTHPDFKQLVSKRLDLTISKGRDFECEYEIWPDRNKNPIWVIGKAKVSPDDNNQPTYLRGTLQDITERKKNELKFLAMHERLEIAATSSNTGVWEYSFKQKQFIFDEVIGSLLDIKEYSRVPLRLWAHLIDHPDKVLQHVREFLRASHDIIRIDYSLLTKSGKQKWIRAFGKLIIDQEGNPVRIIGTKYDNSEDVLRHKSLEKAIDQKNILLREVHHRVKNNMQMISSMLALKAYEVKIHGDPNIIQECQQRIQSMTRIHEHLYRMKDISSIDLNHYLKQIVDEHLAHNDDQNTVNNYLKSPFLTVSPDQALYCGLITDELLTNARKHNLHHCQHIHIDIVLEKKHQTVRMEINNNGSPIPKEVLVSGHSGLGIDLIRTLVSEIQGSIQLNDKNGFTIEFPQEIMP